MGILKNFGLYIVASIAATVLPYLALQYWSGIAYRGFMSFDILVLSIVFVAFRYHQGKLRLALLCFCFLGGILSIGWDWENLYQESFDFAYWVESFRESWKGIFVLILAFLLQIGSCIFVVSRAKPVGAAAAILFILGLVIMHNVMYAINSTIPILEFPALEQMETYSKNQFKDTRNELSKETQTAFPDNKSQAVSLKHLDAARTDVIILLESWGVPMDVKRMQSEFAFFNSLPHVYSGLQKNDSSRTAFAERASFGNAMNALRVHEFESIYLFGGSDSLHERFRYIPAMGFQKIFFGKDLNGDSCPYAQPGICDKNVAAKIDSLLSEVTLNSADSTHKIIAWTTLATHFPMKNSSTYYNSLQQTQSLIISLAKKHPEVRFIVLGDHEPLLCSKAFRTAFYRKWVPFVVLN
jgi:hypothetical protein